MSTRLVIDAGHGGSDSGAVYFGYVEKELNLQLALKVQEKFKDYDCKIFMTRTTDKDMSLYDRGHMAVELNCDAFISLHFNAFNGQAKGFVSMYSYLPECAEKSKYIAECIADEYKKAGLHVNGIWTKESETMKGHNWFGVLRGAEPVPALILEGLFMDNPEEIELLKSENFLDRLADIYVKGIVRALNISPKVIKSWEQELGEKAIKSLAEKGKINNPDEWLAKDLTEPTPLWLFFEMCNRM